ncbi:hypothetical protein ANCCAN_19301 [Ancylostoma caninum]|uniref:Uncharacterized protein n=1 Tax=Ancylostoma caninum TaxID=29170 RepID=A0A368FTR0_ANCCA|nr:hypothetical protein ANCCAN_19301 [Ancylostoma caninum]
MRAAVIILLAICATASASLYRFYCPITYKITKDGVDKSMFVAEVKVESNKLTSYWSGYWYDVNVKYEKLLRWWHDWLSEASTLDSVPKTIYISSKCGVYLKPGEKYIIGCDSSDRCNFAKVASTLTAEEKKLVEKQ